MGASIRERRMALNLSQEEVAWEADVAQGSISNYETGRNDIPLSVLVSICRAFGISAVEIVPTLGEASHLEALLALDGPDDGPNGRDGSWAGSRGELTRGAA
ncbi:MAG: helix-turn-helix domain-containing protein [Dehalococcoidia bacterium]|nr:helix-turn-helix domain-containing protein [Dehalococcoidia bacterium]